MDSILEFIAAIVAVGIYGTEDKPRHPVWRILLRIVAFGGGGFALANILLPLGVDVPIVISVLWGFSLLIVLSAEHHFGRAWLSFAAMGTGILVLGALLWAEGFF